MKSLFINKALNAICFGVHGHACKSLFCHLKGLFPKQFHLLSFGFLYSYFEKMISVLISVHDFWSLKSYSPPNESFRGLLLDTYSLFCNPFGDICWCWNVTVTKYNTIDMLNYKTQISTMCLLRILAIVSNYVK